MIQALGDGLLTITALLGVACVLTYQWTTGGAWRDTATGRHVMAFMAAIAAVTVLGTVRALAVDVLHVVDPVWFQVARVATFTSVPLVMAWRLFVILDAARIRRHRLLLLKPLIDLKGDRPIMSRYSKLWVALLGGLVQVALALPSMLDAGVVPPAWEPWIRVLVAIATAAGVYGVHNQPAASTARHTATSPPPGEWTDPVDREVARRPDGGHAAVRVLGLVCALVSLVAVAVPAAGAASTRRPPGRTAGVVVAPVVAPVVTGANVCGDTLLVAFDAYQLAGRTWVATLDDGRARLELLEVSDRSGPDGVWVAVDGVGSGGEHRLRWPRYGPAARAGQRVAAARVAVSGYRSERVAIAGCAA